MEYSAWAPIYERIRSEFGYPFEREEVSAALLESMLPPAGPDPLGALRSAVLGREAIVVGRAPGTGPPPLWRRPSGPKRPVLLCADGATATCLDAGLVPAVIVTDLDGPVASEIAANRRGSVAVVHAHGDNLEELREWVPQFPGRIVGSWAGPPRPNLVNVGGFTDGDRAAFLAAHLGASAVLLWGFDFTTVHETDPARRVRKLAKLDWARRLIGRLALDSASPVFLWARDGSLAPYPTERNEASTR